MQRCQLSSRRLDLQPQRFRQSGMTRESAPFHHLGKPGKTADIVRAQLGLAKTTLETRQREREFDEG